VHAHPLVVLCAAVAGACVGSFLGLVAHRLPQILFESSRQESFSESEQSHLTQTSSPKHLVALSLYAPPSHCETCQQPLQVKHKVPVLSYLYLRGKCAYCSAPVGTHVLWIELLTAIWWALCWLQEPFASSAFAYSAYGSALICLAFIDWQTQLLPDALTQPTLWLGLILSAIGVASLPLKLAVYGAAGGYLFLWLVSRAYKTIRGRVGLGDGDIKLVAAIGAWTGPAPLLALILMASITGALCIVILTAFKKMKANEYIAFGPFLVASALVLIAFKRFAFFAPLFQISSLLFGGVGY
jgi:leader peptidase (prepilin peptidase) / N-methyltransferase